MPKADPREFLFVARLGQVRGKKLIGGATEGAYHGGMVWILWKSESGEWLCGNLLNQELSRFGRANGREGGMLRQSIDARWNAGGILAQGGSGSAGPGPIHQAECRDAPPSPDPARIFPMQLSG